MASNTTGARSGGPFRLSGRATVILGATIALLLIYATDQIAPASSDRQAQLRVWLAARATGVTALVLLTAQVTLGLVLSHPTNKSTWKLSKTIFPWHDHLWVFVASFLGVHVVSLVLDPWAGVGIEGALIPGLSAYRSVPVALGTLALYAFLVTALTARFTKLLPRGMWLVLHRVSGVTLALAWVHGMLAGTDSRALQPLYIACGLAVLGAIAYRYWAVRQARPSFATTLSEVTR